jgi:hypothetical protein
VASIGEEELGVAYLLLICFLWLSPPPINTVEDALLVSP